MSEEELLPADIRPITVEIVFDLIGEVTVTQDREALAVHEVFEEIQKVGVIDDSGSWWPANAIQKAKWKVK